MHCSSPEVILVQTKTACTRKCWHCRYGLQRHALNAHEEIISWDTIGRIIEQLQDASYHGRLSWFRINEPLIDPRIQKIITVSKSRLPFAYHTLATNGDLLDQNVCYELFSAGLDELVISTYDEEDFRKAMKLSHSFVGVTIKDRRKSGWLENRGGNISKITAKRSEAPCYRPSTALNIIPSGDIVLCCGDLFGDVVLGNINVESLWEIWSGTGFEHYRSILKNSRLGLKLCEQCSHTGRGHTRIPVGTIRYLL